MLLQGGGVHIVPSQSHKHRASHISMEPVRKNMEPVTLNQSHKHGASHKSIEPLNHNHCSLGRFPWTILSTLKVPCTTTVGFVASVDQDQASQNLQPDP